MSQPGKLDAFLLPDLRKKSERGPVIHLGSEAGWNLCPQFTTSTTRIMAGHQIHPTKRPESQKNRLDCHNSDNNFSTRY